MLEKNLIEKIENISLPNIENSRHKARLKAHLLDSECFKERKYSFEWEKFAVMGLSGAFLFLIFFGAKGLFFNEPYAKQEIISRIKSDLAFLSDKPSITELNLNDKESENNLNAKNIDKLTENNDPKKNNYSPNSENIVENIFPPNTAPTPKPTNNPANAKIAYIAPENNQTENHPDPAAENSNDNTVNPAANSSSETTNSLTNNMQSIFNSLVAEITLVSQKGDYWEINIKKIRDYSQNIEVNYPSLKEGGNIIVFVSGFALSSEKSISSKEQTSGQNIGENSNKESLTVGKNYLASFNLCLKNTPYICADSGLSAFLYPY